MDKATALVAIVFFGLTLHYLCLRLMDLSILAVDKSLGAVPAFFKGCLKLTIGALDLVLVMFKALVRVCVRLCRFYTSGVTREGLTAVGPSEIQVTVNPTRTENALGHTPTWKIGTEQRAPVTIDHQPIRR